MLRPRGLTPGATSLDGKFRAQAGAASDPRDDYSDFLSILLALEGAAGFGWQTPREPTFFGGLKLGLPVAVHGQYPHETLRTATLDMGYDRHHGHSGFSTELSLMLPVLRFPTPRTDEARYLRVYAEPGAGYRSGGQGLGVYGSAKVMLAFFSNRQLAANLETPGAPFVEVQHRFPITSLLHGETRVVIGVMFASCNHCGPD
jgi:hypothetical protein